MVKMFQLMHEVIDLDYTEFVELSRRTRTRGHQLKLAKPTALTRVRRNALGVRAISDWNALPESVISVQSLSQFKSKLDTHWQDLRYWIPENE